MKVNLKLEAGDSVTITEGTAYHRIFNRADEPFEVTAEEMLTLAPTGRFEEAQEDAE